MKNKTFSLLLIAALIAAALGAALPAQPVRAAGLITVNSSGDGLSDNGQCTLREAIINANTGVQGWLDCPGMTGGADEIVFSVASVTLSSELPAITSDITIHGGGSVIIQAAAAPNTATYRIFNVNSGGKLRLDLVYLKNGRCNGSCAVTGTDGGAILNLGELELHGGRIEDNSGSNIVYTGPGGVVTVDYTRFINNTGSALTVNAGSATTNSTVTKAHFKNNSAYQGAAIYAYNLNAHLTVVQSAFESNTSTDYGGAIYAANSGAGDYVSVINSTFYDNSAKSGGAIATGSGQEIQIANSTIYNNTATDPAGISGVHADILSWVNTVIADATTKTDCSVVTSISNVSNFVGDGSCSAALSGNPKLGSMYPRQDTIFGEQIFSFPPVYGSPLIDAGFDAACGEIGGVDIFGTARPIGSHCDIGSYEISITPPTVVSITRAEANPTAAASVDFTVTFSESVTGVDAADFTLTTTGVSGAPVSGVSGSDATRTVTVNTGSGNGTIRLDLKASGTGIVDALNAPINGGFTSGQVYTINKTLTFTSDGANDGWVLESTETSGKGGTLDSAATTFRLGDGTGDKQYRSILSFDTSALPDAAVITKVTLKIRQSGAPVGTNPFTILGALRVDIRKTRFGSSAALVNSDFQAAASQANIGAIPTTPVSGWYSRTWASGAFFAYIHRAGVTQFRLSFAKDDNNDNGADYMKFTSGNHATASVRPTLIIEYFVP